MCCQTPLKISDMTNKRQSTAVSFLTNQKLFPLYLPLQNQQVAHSAGLLYASSSPRSHRYVGMLTVLTFGGVPLLACHVLILEKEEEKGGLKQVVDHPGVRSSHRCFLGLLLPYTPSTCQPWLISLMVFGVEITEDQPSHNIFPLLSLFLLGP